MCPQAQKIYYALMNNVIFRPHPDDDNTIWSYDQI